jgi:hypothetical protein
VVKKRRGTTENRGRSARPARTDDAAGPGRAAPEISGKDGFVETQPRSTHADRRRWRGNNRIAEECIELGSNAGPSDGDTEKVGPSIQHNSFAGNFFPRIERDLS